MKIILLDNIEKLGNIGSEVIVKSGYARNFLFPKSKAMLATKENLKIFKERQSALAEKVIENCVKAESYADAINQLDSISIAARSNIEGKLFGSIGAQNIATVLTESVGFKISKSQVRLPNGSVLKSIGSYDIKIHIYNTISASIKVIIVNEFLKDTKNKN